MNPERFARIRQMLAMRQPDLTVCLEEVHKPHKLAAMIRTCDAVGIPEVHAVWPQQMRTRNNAAKGSQYWVKLNRHETIEEAVGALRQQGMQILATHLCAQAVDFRDIDYTRPTAILLGAEKHGISPQALPHIFERYYQENGDHQASGSGIGLALVKSLVELHQGTITAESTAGEGSTFTVSLPTE